MKAAAKVRPYWRYRHSPASTVPRAEHVAWDGLILKHDDPFWAAHTPPNGFGCKCFIESLAERDMKKQGLEVTDQGKIPFNGKDPDTGLPQGVGKGWDYQPGASVADDQARLEKMKEDKLKRLGVGGGASTDMMVDAIDDPGKGPDRGRLRTRPIGLSGLWPDQAKALSGRELELARRSGTEKAYGVAKDGGVVVE